MRVTQRVMGLLAIGLVGTAGAAQAQASFFTTGFFTGTSQGACTPTTAATAAAIATCIASPYTLMFKGSGYTNVAGSIDFGTLDFTSTGPGSLTLGADALFFNLIINQTGPTPGSSTVIGAVTGTVTTATGANSSNLIFTPSPTSFSIGAATYSFNFDNAGPAAGRGYVIPIDQTATVPSTALKGFVTVATTTTAPEPGSVALVVTGLAGLIPVAIRRRKR